jgi:hypothetical protein
MGRISRLFQGRVGFARAIIVLEEGCEEVSNIQGLGQIRFPPKKIKTAFQEIREVLERENIKSREVPGDSAPQVGTLAGFGQFSRSRLFVKNYFRVSYVNIAAESRSLSRVRRQLRKSHILCPRSLFLRPFRDNVAND